jgi:hypothetical protein
MGADPEDTYFDLPRMRVIPHEGFLDTGVSYNYKAHRDTWYAGPKALVNYWTPIYDAVGENVMSMYVGYFDRPIKNSSSDFDYDRWWPSRGSQRRSRRARRNGRTRCRPSRSTTSARSGSPGGRAT